MAKFNFNEHPYYDDYVPSNRFYKILFKPSLPLQNRELNQSQTIIHENIKNISNVILNNGDPLKPGQLIYSNKVDYVTLDTIEPRNNFHFNPLNINSTRYLIGRYITDNSVRIKAQIISGAPKSIAQSQAPVLYVAYTYSDGNQSSQNVTFTTGDDLYELRADGSKGDRIGVVGRPSSLYYPVDDTGIGSIAQLKSGVYYINGYAVEVAGQSLILEKFGTTPTYRIGLGVGESIITAGQDSSLADSANGGAIGADRYRISLALIKKSIETPSNESFIELMRVTDGHPARKDTYLGQLFTEDEYTSRHSETFGNYIEKPFNIEIREHSSANTDHNGIAGIYSTDGDSDKLVIGVDGGTAVLNGKSLSLPSKQYVNIDKQRGATNLVTATSAVSVAADFGFYVVTDNGFSLKTAQASKLNTDDERTWLNFSPQSTTVVPFGENSGDSTRVYLSNSITNLLGQASIRNIEREKIGEEFRIYLFDIQSSIATLGTSNLLEDTEFLQVSDGSGGFIKICDLNTELGSKVSATNSGSLEMVAFDPVNDTADIGNYKPFSEGVLHYADAEFTTLNDTLENKLVYSIPKEAVGNDNSSVSSVTINKMRSTLRIQSGANDILTYTLGGSETFDLTNNVAVTEQLIDLDEAVGLNVGDIVTGSSTTAYGKIVQVDHATTGPLADATSIVVEITNSDGSSNTSGTPLFTTSDTLSVYSPRYVLPSDNAKAVSAVSAISGYRNRDYLLYGAYVKIGDASNLDAMMYPTDGFILQFSNSNQTLTVRDQNIIDTKHYVVIANVKTSAAAEVAKLLKKATKHVAHHTTTSTLSGAISHIQLDYADVMEKNWTVYENKDGFDPATSNQASTSDTDISNRYTLNSGQRDNSYSVGFLELKENQPMPSGSLYIVYYYLQHGSDAQQSGGTLEYRVGDYISVDSYPIGETSTPSGWPGNFTYDDIPTFVSPTTGEKIRLADTIDFRPVKNASDDYVHNSRMPFHTTVDIGTLKYFQPRIDKVYLTEGENVEEIVTSSKLEVGEIYKIVTVGTTLFNFVGAESNTPGVIFRATGRIVGTGTVTKAEGNLRVVKGIPYDGELVLPTVPENGVEVAEIKVPAYTHSTTDVKIKPVDNLHRKESESSKLEKVLENLQDHISKNPLEEKAKTYDIGAGRKLVGSFVDSFEGHANADVSDTYYSVSIDRINNVLRPEFTIENLSWNLTPVDYNELRNSSNYLTLPLLNGDEYALEIRNSESNISVMPRTTHTFDYHGYMIITPSFDNWKSTKSRPDLLINKNNEFDSIKHQKKPHQTHRSNWNDWQTHWSGHSKVEFEKDDSDTSYEGLIKSLKKTYEVDSNTLEIDSNKSLQRDYVPYIRSQNIKIAVYGLKPNVGNLRIKFDGRDITSDVRTNVLTSSSYINAVDAVLKTDDYGTFAGWFTIPNVDEGVGTTKYTTGKKKIIVDSTVVGVDSYSEGTFNAVGYVDNKISTRNLEGSWETQTRDAYHQEFEIFQDCFAGKIDLYFTGKENYGGIRPIILQLRKMDGGVPSNDCIPLSTVVKYPTDTLTLTSNASTNWSLGETLTGVSSGAKAVIIDFPANTNQVVLRSVRGEWTVAGENVTNGTTVKVLSTVSTGISTDGITPCTFIFSDFIFLPKGNYCITLITSCRSYQLKALDVNRLEGSKMTGIGGTFQGLEEIKNQVLQFNLWRCKFNTGLSAADSTVWLKTQTLPDVSPTKDNALYTYGNAVATKNQIKVDLDSHGFATGSSAKLTFKGVSGRNNLEANLASSSSSGAMGAGSSFVKGEIMYQRATADASNATDYVHGILIDYNHGSNPKTIKIMMTSTGTFANSSVPIWGATSGVNGVLNSSPSTKYSFVNHYKRMMNGIDLDYINDSAVTSLDDGAGNDKDFAVTGSGYSVTTSETGDPTTGGTGIGLTVRIPEVSGGGVVAFNAATGEGGIWIVNPGYGYTDNDLITIVGGNNNATIYVSGIRRNEYQTVSSTHDTVDVKRVGTGNVIQPSGDTNTVDVNSFHAGRTNFAEASLKISSDLAGEGPRRKVDLIHYGESSILPESTRLSWERADTFNGTLKTTIPASNIQLESSKIISNNTFLKNIFTSEYDRVSPVIDKTVMNTTLVTNRIDGTEELSSYISRKVKLKDGANSVKVILDALIPVGSNVNVYARTDTDISLDLEDNVIPFSDQHLWILVPQSSTIITDDRNIHQEVEYLKDGLGMFGTFQIKVAFKSTSSIKMPSVKNLIAIANHKDDSLLPLQSFTIQGDLICTAANTVTATKYFAIETDFRVLHGTVFLIDYDNNGNYYTHSTISGDATRSSLDFVRTSASLTAFVKTQENAIKALDVVNNTGCVVTITNNDSNARNFRFVAHIYGR